jgi:hypothetical protein
MTAGMEAKEASFECHPGGREGAGGGNSLRV